MNKKNNKLVNHYDIIVLAAGESNRFHKGNKLLFKINQSSILSNVIKEICLIKKINIIVITGFQHETIQNELRKYDVRIIQNKHYSYGKSTSISLGIKSLPKKSAAVMICLADMPLIKSHNYQLLLSYHQKSGGRDKITAPVRNGKIGNPIIWGALYYKELLKINGDLGGRQILNNYRQKLNFCEVESRSFFIDIDTQDDLCQIGRNNKL